MALTLSGSNGVVGAGFSINPVGTVAGIATFSAAKVGAAVTISESGIDAVGLGITVRNINDSHIGGRRRININGDMMVAQRATSASVSDGSNEGYSTLDRWYLLYSSAAGGVITLSQDTDVPTDYTWGRFNHSAKLDVTTADTSIGDAHAVTFQYRIEAKDIRNSGWNYTSSDSTLSVSFWAKSVKAGTYCVFLFSQDGTQRNNVQEYTLVANTWKHIELEFPGDSSISFDDNTDNGLTVGWALQAGPHRYESVVNGQWLNRSVGNNHGKYATSNQVNFLDSTDNNFYLTGVQIEVGKATRFEHRSFNDELALCQRYFQKYTCSAQEWIYVESDNASHKWWGTYFNPMRAQPTVDLSNLSTGSGATAAGSGGNTVSLVSLVSTSSDSSANGRISCRVTFGGAWGSAYSVAHIDAWSGDSVTFSSEI